METRAWPGASDVQDQGEGRREARRVRGGALTQAQRSRFREITSSSTPCGRCARCPVRYGFRGVQVVATLPSWKLWSTLTEKIGTCSKWKTNQKPLMSTSVVQLNGSTAQADPLQCGQQFFPFWGGTKSDGRHATHIT